MQRATAAELKRILNAPVCEECGKMQIKLEKNGKCAECNSNKPEYGKIYSLTGGKNTPCIMNGNTWKESEIAA